MNKLCQDNVGAKASRNQPFIMRNLRRCKQQAKTVSKCHGDIYPGIHAAQSYKARLQHRGTCYGELDYSIPGSVTHMETLQWEPLLLTGRTKARLADSYLSSGAQKDTIRGRGVA